MAIQTVSVPFTGAEDSVNATWSNMIGNFGISRGVTIADGSGPIDVWITGASSTGGTVNVSARFTGTVDLIIYDKP